MLYFLMFMLGGVFFISQILKRGFALSIPLFVLFSVSLLYIFGLIGILSIAVFCLVGISAAGYILLILNIVRKKIDSSIITSGLIAFIVLYALLALTCYNHILYTWDDFSHWGVMVKETLRLDDFYNIAGSTFSAHKDYPPIITLFEYLGCKLNGGYSEPMVLLSIHIFTFSFIMPVFEKISIKKDTLKFALVFSVMLILPALIGDLFYNSIYIDSAIGVLFGYGIYLIMSSELDNVFDCLVFILYCFVVPLTKQIAVYFILCIYLFLFLYYIIPANARGLIKSLRGRERKALVKALMYAAGIIITFVSIKSWDIYMTDVIVPSGRFDAGQISISGFIGIIRGEGVWYRLQTYGNFIEALFSRAVLTKPFPITYFQATVIITGICIVIGFQNWKKCEHKDWLKIRSFLLTLPMSMIGYAFVMLLTYVFLFGDIEGPPLASYERYMATFILGALVAIALFIAGSYKLPSHTEEAVSSRKKDILTWTLFAVLMCSCVTFDMLPNLPDANEIKDLKNQAEGVSGVVEYGEDKVYLIAQGYSSYQYYLFNYYGHPIEINTTRWSIGSNESEFTDNSVGVNELAEILIDEAYTYVYLYAIDDLFINEFASLFEDNEAIQEGQLYKVVENNSTISLDLVDMN